MRDSAQGLLLGMMQLGGVSERYMSATSVIDGCGYAPVLVSACSRQAARISEQRLVQIDLFEASRCDGRGMRLGSNGSSSHGVQV